jgi:Tol biopolymer transport system component
LRFPRIGHTLNGWTGPSWSPDGNQIAYVGAKNGSLQIFVVNVDGKGAEAITASPGANAWPAYSPDGRYIAYIHYEARPEKTGEQGTLMLFDVEALTDTPIAPAGMRVHSRLSWKP